MARNFTIGSGIKHAQLVFEASKQDTIPLGNGKAGSNRFYQKGAWVLYMLDEQLGHETFRKVIRNYLEKNKFGIVTTESFNKAIREVTGKDFSSFFDQWVFTAGEPQFRVDLTLEKQQVDLMYVPNQMPFKNPHIKVPLELHFKDGSVREYAINLLDSVDLISLDSLDYDPREVTYWVLNPDFAVLATIHEKKPYEMWEAQYEHSAHMLDRYFAILALREFDMKEKSKLLLSAFENQQEFFSIRAEALSQLVNEGYKKAGKFLNQALLSADVQLQKEAIQLVRNPDEEQLQIIARLCQGRSYELRENAISLRINTELPDSNQWLLNPVFYKEPGIPGHKVAITALLYRSAFLKDADAFLQLKNYTSSGYDFITRTKAMEALAALQYFDKEMAGNYFDALFNRNHSLSRDARNYLKKYYEIDSAKKIINDYISWHQEAWSDFQKRLVNRTFDLNPD